MKATLTFELDTPEDIAAHLRCTKALDLVLCLNEFETQLLCQYKYDEITDEKKAIVKEVIDLLTDTMNDYGINMYELHR
jgi:hypothetical protein